MDRYRIGDASTLRLAGCESCSLCRPNRASARAESSRPDSGAPRSRSSQGNQTEDSFCRPAGGQAAFAIRSRIRSLRRKTMRTESLTTARKEFSKLVEEVEKGESIQVTRGRLFATLLPHTPDRMSELEWEAAYRRMMAQLPKGVSLGGLRVRRDELYGRLGAASRSNPASSPVLRRRCDKGLSTRDTRASADRTRDGGSHSAVRRSVELEAVVAGGLGPLGARGAVLSPRERRSADRPVPDREDIESAMRGTRRTARQERFDAAEAGGRRSRGLRPAPFAAVALPLRSVAKAFGGFASGALGHFGRGICPRLRDLLNSLSRAKTSTSSWR